MHKRKDELHVITFDPGGKMGWAHFVVHVRAFSHPREKVLKNLLGWRCGEFDGTEHEKVRAALDLIRMSRYRNGRLYTARYEIVTEDFELTQLIGGKDLLIPVRINAILEYQLAQGFQLPLSYQNRAMRTGVTRKRLRLMGLWPVKGKDAFAAVQHNVTYLKRLKAKADEQTWERLLRLHEKTPLLYKEPKTPKRQPRYMTALSEKLATLKR